MELIWYYIVQIFTAKFFKGVLSSIFVAFTWLIGGIDLVGIALLVIVCSDFILGFSRAWINGTPSRAKFKKGIGKFFTYGMLVVLGNLLDIIFFHKTSVDYGWRNWFIVYLSVNESLSVCKHLQYFGVPLPEKLLVKLEHYRDGVNLNVDHNR